MQVESKSITELIPYAKNSRTHSDAHIAQIAASIKEFGFTNALLIDGENVVIAGHGRLEAARKLKMDDVPCVVLDHMTDAQKRAYIIADNKLALNAGWDDELLALELEELKDLDFDLSVIGFDLDELADILSINIEKELNEEQYISVLNIIIECDDENSQQQAYDDLTEMGYKCQVQSL